LAHTELKRRARIDADGNDETKYLRPLDEFRVRGITPAEDLPEKFRGLWHGSLDPLYAQ
jgi:glutamate--cysteine ligase